MHTIKMWLKHNDGPPTDGYAYGERPPAEEWDPGFGNREASQPYYRGVPIPGVPGVDVESWMRGVDAALDRYELGEDR